MKTGKECSRKSNNVGVDPEVRNSWVSSGAEFSSSQLVLVSEGEGGIRWAGRSDKEMSHVGLFMSHTEELGLYRRQIRNHWRIFSMGPT